jgi:pyrimidine operon attenuation protein / uracil phosphoribosyltransferase
LNLIPDAESVYRALREQLNAAMSFDAKLVGIYSGGVWVAQRLARELHAKPQLGKIDVSFYRDDFKTAGLKSVTRRTEIPFEVDGAHIVLVDDVLYTGRSVRAAINELFDYGRPASIQLAVLFDRGGRELPFQPDYVGERMVVADAVTLVLKQSEAEVFSLTTESR